jgi:hypothetical protein
MPKIRYLHHGLLRTLLSIFVPELSRLRGRQHVVEPFRSDLELQVINKLRDGSD